MKSDIDIKGADDASSGFVRHHSHGWKQGLSRSCAGMVSRALAAAIVSFLLLPSGARAQEVGLVKLDVKDVAKGYRANALKLKPVVNDKDETIGHIDDFIFERDGSQVFAVVAVGDFIGLDGHLIAVPFRSLKFNGPTGSIVLPGANREALMKLPVFLYNH